MLTKEEQAWAEENMKEDFTIGFSKKIRFTHGEPWTIEGDIPVDEAESDGYFCAKCGGTEINDLETHVKSCMYTPKIEIADKEEYFVISKEENWADGPHPTMAYAEGIAERICKDRPTTIAFVAKHVSTVMGYVSASARRPTVTAAPDTDAENRG